MKKGNVLYGILFGLLMVFLFSFAIQEQFSLFKMKPLNGRYAAVSMPKLTKETYQNGYFQKASEKYISRNFGFREPIIRLYNQYCWDFYRKTYVSYTFAGKKNWLFYAHNIENYYGTEMYHWFDDVESARQSYEREIRLLNKIRGILKDYDVTLLTFIAPSKADIYPEYLPYRKYDTTTLNAREYFTKRFVTTGLPCFDMTDYFLRMKDTCAFSVFPPTGDHWNFSCVYATDSLMRFMEEQRGIQMPRIEYSNEYLSTCRIGDARNRDLEPEMNLMRPVKVFPEFSHKERDYHIVTDSLTTKPAVLFVGNSFLLWTIEYIPPTELFSDYNFWYYNKRAYQGLEQIVDSVSHLNRLDVLLDADYIIWFSSASQMYRATEGFAEDAIIQLCIGDERFQQRQNELIDSLFNDKFTRKRIAWNYSDSLYREKLRSYTKNLLRKDPEAYFPEIAGESIPEVRNPLLLDNEYLSRCAIRRQIKRDPKWMTAIATDMALENLTVQQVIDKEIDNVIEGLPVLRDTHFGVKEYKELLVMKMEEKIKRDPNWLKLVKTDAEKKGISVDENIHNHALYTVNTQIAKGEIKLPDNE